MRMAGLELEEKAETSVRLNGSHFDAIKVIIARESRPGVPMKRIYAIRAAIHAYCSSLSLTVGRRYVSFTDLVRDALLWYAEKPVDEGETPIPG